MEKEKIHDFAIDLLEKFQNPDIQEWQIVDDFSFEGTCTSLGFEMDCGEGIVEKFRDRGAFDEWRVLERGICRIDDIVAIGSAIFSKWSYFNQWAGPDESILEPDNKKWFIIALTRLEELTR